MNLDRIIQALSKESEKDDTNHSELIRQLFELKASIRDNELNKHLLHSLIEKYARSERNLISANKKLSDKNKQIQKTLAERNYAFQCLDKELSDAANYIKTILPQPFTGRHFRIDWRFIPSSSLGGDAFGYHWLDKTHFAIYLVDVSGHGVGPALLSVSVINTLRSQSLPRTDFKEPERVLDALNKAFPSTENNHMFFTIWYGVYNQERRELTFSSGGHPPALLLTKSDSRKVRIKPLRTHNLIIGALENAVYDKKTLQLPENSKLFIFSDGVYEIKKTNGIMWQFEEFVRMMTRLETENRLNFDTLIEQTKRIGTLDTFPDDYTIIEFCMD